MHSAIFIDYMNINYDYRFIDLYYSATFIYIRESSFCYRWEQITNSLPGIMQREREKGEHRHQISDIVLICCFSASSKSLGFLLLIYLIYDNLYCQQAF